MLSPRLRAKTSRDWKTGMPKRAVNMVIATKLLNQYIFRNRNEIKISLAAVNYPP